MNISKNIPKHNTFKNKKILIVGASSDLASGINEKLHHEKAILGLHYNKNIQSIIHFPDSKKVKKFKKKLDSANDCYNLVDEFANWAGGIDILIQLSGDICRPIHWKDITEKDWNYDLLINLITPFFLTQKAIKYMKKSGGKILLTSTSSAIHGGGTSSIAYGTAKAGIECIVKRLAKDCAKYNILINAIAPGLIITKFHTNKMKRTQKQLQKRLKLVPLKRSGKIEEITGTISFLISEKASFITGQTITIDGGDWL